MNILVTGGSGQLGQAIKEVAKDSEHRFVYTCFRNEGQDTYFSSLFSKSAGLPF